MEHVLGGDHCVVLGQKVPASIEFPQMRMYFSRTVNTGTLDVWLLQNTYFCYPSNILGDKPLVKPARA